MELSNETLELINNIDVKEIDIEGFKNLLKELSVDLNLHEGAKTILYSGEMHNIKTVSVAEKIEGVRFIADTELGKFMSNSKGKDIIRTAIKNELTRGTFDINLVKSSLNIDDYIDDIEGYNSLTDSEKIELVNELYTAYIVQI